MPFASNRYLVANGMDKMVTRGLEKGVHHFVSKWRVVFDDMLFLFG
jgi:hypothetical protein